MWAPRYRRQPYKALKAMDLLAQVYSVRGTEIDGRSLRDRLHQLADLIVADVAGDVHINAEIAGFYWEAGICARCQTLARSEDCSCEPHTFDRPPRPSDQPLGSA